jgi:SPP1 family predicted phage head-tail adaptor
VIRAGELRHRATIQQDSGTTTDTTGGRVSNWTTFRVLQVKLESMEAWEFDALRRRFAEASYALVARFTTGIVPAMRVSCEGRTFDILGAVDPDGRRTELHIAVREMDL